MSKWMMITCLIIIPVNIFSILTIWTVGISYRDKMAERLRGNLNAYAQQVDSNHRVLQNDIVTDILSSNLAALTGGDASDSILTDLRLKNSLASLQGSFPDFVSYYLFDREKDFVSFFSRKYDLSEEIKNCVYLFARDYQQEKGSAQNMLSVDGKNYMLIHYPFPYFSFGYLMDLDVLLQSCYASCAEGGGAAFLNGQDGTALLSYPASNSANLQMEKAFIQQQAKISSVNVSLDYQITAREVYSMYPPIFYMFFAFALLSVLVIPLLYILAKRLIQKPLSVLAEGMQEVETGKLEYRVQEQLGSLQMNYLAETFNHMTGEIRHMRIASYEQEIGKLQTETINVHLQVNQHMLMNSLNVVYSLIQMKRYEEASEFTVLLMKYFQYALRKNSALVTVQEEITFVEDYIRLQKIRFKNRFSSVCQVTDEVRDLLIPQLLIQGFVENAVKYALAPDRMTEILIDIQKRDGRLLISVIDTGEGMDEERVQALREGRAVEDATGKHVGLWNVRKRLDYYYGEDYRLEITSGKNEGTMIHVSLPLQPKDTEQMARIIRNREIAMGKGEEK
jgi:sensor histidine kinase YesM